MPLLLRGAPDTAVAEQAPTRRGYLERVWRATEVENRRVIMDVLPRGGGGALLDLGPNDGTFTCRVAAHLGADRVAGVELIDGHAGVARGNGVEVTCADIDDGLPFGDAEFDVVHANQVIEHVRRTDAFLREIARVLRPGGLAVISTNNFSSWHNVGSLALGFQPMPAHVSDEVIVGNPLDPRAGQEHEDLGQTHLRVFTGRALVELCETHGLRCAELRTSGYYPLPPRLGRVMARLDPLHGAFLVGAFERAG